MNAIDWAALAAWVVTAGGGAIMLFQWVARGGLRQRETHGAIGPTVVLGHFGLAATGLGIWIAYMIADIEDLAWASFAALVVVALGGFVMVSMWLQQRRGKSLAPEVYGGETAERRFPLAIVGGHGLLAVATLVLVVLASAGVGGSS
jgi:hypothetical protein